MARVGPQGHTKQLRPLTYRKLVITLFRLHFHNLELIFLLYFSNWSVILIQIHFLLSLCYLSTFQVS